MPAVIIVALIGVGLIAASFVTPVKRNPLAAQPADAALSVSGASILGSGCTSQSSRIKWAGAPKEMTSPPALPGDDPKGTVFVCWTKYRISDKDTKADYYGALAESYWTLSQGRTDGKAVASQMIKSTVGAKDSVYGATSGFTSSKSCAVDIPLSLSFSVVSASVPVRVCKGFRVTRPTYGTTGAAWTTTNAGSLRTLRTMYAEKVPAGKVPKFTFTFVIPKYTKVWNTGYMRWEWTSHLAYQTFSSK